MSQTCRIIDHQEVARVTSVHSLVSPEGGTIPQKNTSVGQGRGRAARERPARAEAGLRAPEAGGEAGEAGVTPGNVASVTLQPRSVTHLKVIKLEEEAAMGHRGQRGASLG